MRNYSCSEHLCCLLQFIEQTFGIYLASHDIFFMWSSVYASLVYMSWDWAACQGAGGCSQQQALLPQDPCGTLSYSCSSPTREQVPPTPPAPFWGCVWSCMASPLLFFPRTLSGQSHRLGIQKAVWCPGVAWLGQWWRHLFLYLLPKIFFSLCGLCHLTSGNMRNLPWLPTELGWPLSLCPQRLCTVVPASDHPLFPHVTPMAVSPGRNLHLSAMCIHRGHAFHPSSLPCASPSTASQPASTSGYRADFCPPRAQPAGQVAPAHVKSSVVLLVPIAAPRASLHPAQWVLLPKAQVPAIHCYLTVTSAKMEKKKPGWNLGWAAVKMLGRSCLHARSSASLSWMKHSWFRKHWSRNTSVAIAKYRGKRNRKISQWWAMPPAQGYNKF